MGRIKERNCPDCGKRMWRHRFNCQWCYDCLNCLEAFCQRLFPEAKENKS
jgi:hypothetical protein